MINYLFDQRIFIEEIFINKSLVEQQIQVSNTVGNFIMQIVEGIMNIQVRHDSSNFPIKD